MKKVLSLVTTVMLLCATALSIQTQSAGTLKGRVIDIAGMPIPKVRITVKSSTETFNVISNEDGCYEIDLPAGSYEIGSDKLPGFATTRREGVRVEPGKIVEVNIVPAVSFDGALCVLTITDAPFERPKKRKKRH
ncbi:MAG: carboxypeptidase-like regulatory domain-containing protein [Pyrinomonadaceae bacterium]|nr:carboxypeptidase-like regulatory domain-containing protein [Pyrinomonadaceae bacterium]